MYFLSIKVYQITVVTCNKKIKPEVWKFGVFSSKCFMCKHIFWFTNKCNVNGFILYAIDITYIIGNIVYY